jgi:hypothetical protein
MTIESLLPLSMGDWLLILFFVLGLTLAIATIVLITKRKHFTPVFLPPLSAKQLKEIEEQAIAKHERRHRAFIDGLMGRGKKRRDVDF